MTKTDAGARLLAAQTVAHVLREGVTLDAALNEALSAAPATMRPAVRSLSYGAVRGYFRHEAILGKVLSQPVRSLDPEVRALLSVALFELEDARTPQYAVVDAAVKSAKAGAAARASGLVNAVLRRYLRERTALDIDIARNPVLRHAAPIWLADRYRADWPVRWTQLLAAGDTQAPMWLRVDSRRATTDSYLDLLRGAGLTARAEARVPFAVVLDSPCDVHDLPGFAAGLVSVQDLGAQCVAFPLELAAGQRVLDACAAPGGKTGLIAERAPDLARLVALDIDPQRLARVEENLRRGNLPAEFKAGDTGAAAAENLRRGNLPAEFKAADAGAAAAKNLRRGNLPAEFKGGDAGDPAAENLRRGNLQVELKAGDAGDPAAWWDGLPFDRILVDAPCSALGVIRRHPDIRLRKSPAEIDKLPLLQTRLLAAAWRMLAPGGRLVYATCTVTRSENRDVVAAFLDRTPGASIVAAETWPGWPGFGETDGLGRQILPGEAGADGFYYAALLKQ